MIYYNVAVAVFAGVLFQLELTASAVAVALFNVLQAIREAGKQ